MPRRNFFLQTLTDVHTRSRGYLPHWELEGATYSVTFRLHGSLPASVIANLNEYRRSLTRLITGGMRKLTFLENMDLRARFEHVLDDALHEQTGVAFMNDPAIAELIANPLTYFDGQRYELDAWCVMPNHVHVVFRLLGQSTLARVLHSWKSYSSWRANEILGREGRFWQREYFDRIVRNEEDFAQTVGYVVRNPEKAGLREWPWVWSAGWKPADRPAGSRRSVSRRSG